MPTHSANLRWPTLPAASACLAPQLQALYTAQGPGCAATSPLSSLQPGTRSLGVWGVCTWVGPHPPAAPPAPAVWPHAGSSPQSRGRSGRG